MKKNQYTVQGLINLIPEEFLDVLADQTDVDYQVKKLSGKLIFKLLLYGFASQKELSWRILEQLFTHFHFKQFAELSPQLRTDHSSLATRVSKIKVSYFERIHEFLCAKVTNEFAPERIGGYKIVRFDSTLVSIAGTLLNKMAGLRVGIRPKYVKPGDPVHLKFSVGFDGLKPIVAKVYDGQTYLSEDVALREIIKQYKCTDKEMIVFDRGISRRATWDEFNGQGRVFVTRVRALKDKVRHEVLKELTNIDQAHPICIGNLLVEKDQLVYLMNQNHKKTKYPYRLIRTYNPKKKKVYFFLTNELDLSLKEILQIYQRRWDIEVFFKFLKQEFGFKHFLARNRNGIEVILFMTLITFILVYIYFKYNGIESFKIAKLKFIQELEFDSMKLIVEFCKGDAQLLHLLKPF